MQPLQITLRDIPNSIALEMLIRKKVEKLKTFNNRMISCHVVVDKVQNHKHQGKLYNVRIDTLVPGKELVVTKKSDEDVYIAIRDSFHAITRQLEENSQKRHGRVKLHNHVMHGHIVRLVRSDGYGFIEGTDGSEYYFSMTNVSHPLFGQLAVGDAVEYTPDVTKGGLHAQHIVREKHNNHAIAEGW